MWKKSLLLTAVLFAGSAAAASAQEVIAKVPFPFVVSGETLPTGEYVVARLDDGGDLIVIRGMHASQKAAVIVETTPAAGHDPAGRVPSLTFTHSGGQYELSTIWESRIEGLALPKH